MYWLNPMSKRVERAWMDGQFLDTNPFDTTQFVNVSSVSALTLDVADRRLYYVQHLAGKDSSEIVQCYFYDRKSCRVMANRIRAFDIGIFKDNLIWTEISKEGGGLQMCKKKNCRSTMASIEGFKNIESFALMEAYGQPARVKPNPCLVNNGNCSHYCLLLPGEPWRSCACPTGIKLSSENVTCAPVGMEKVLFVASKTGLFYFSLDTDDLTPQAMEIPNFNPSTTIILGVDYDAESGNVYWSEADGGESRIRKCAFKECSSVETILRFDKPTHIESLAIDHESRNLYLVDSGLRRISVSRLDGSSSRVLISHGLTKPRGLAVDSMNGHIYFSDWDDSNPKIEKANLDGSERTMFILMKHNTAYPNGIDVDAENGKIYWVDAKTLSLKSANLRDASGVTTVAEGLDNPFDVTKLGSNDVIYPFSKRFLLGDVVFASDREYRKLTAVKLNFQQAGPNNTRISDSIWDKKTNTNMMEISDFFIYKQMGVKSVYVQDKPKKSGSPCHVDNGGCSHLCIPR
ncbi:hypothetical protein L596_028376 [Steinernema carpocapsae]|nr:hypothetical protein L596_028376 [Steinernema carpocapsae]